MALLQDLLFAASDLEDQAQTARSTCEGKLICLQAMLDSLAQAVDRVAVARRD